MSERKPTLTPDASAALEAFESRAVRRTWHEGHWWFAVVDVIAALTDSPNPEGYLKDLRRRDPELAKGWGQIATPLRMTTPGGTQALNCATVEGVLRVIQSIPSPRAEPFKRWLAQVGYERIQELDTRSALEALREAQITHHRLKRGRFVDSELAEVSVVRSFRMTARRTAANTGSAPA